jgi:hypothetical protein
VACTERIRFDEEKIHFSKYVHVLFKSLKKYSSNVNVAAECLTPCKNIHSIVLQIIKKKKETYANTHSYMRSRAFEKKEREGSVYTPP